MKNLKSFSEYINESKLNEGAGAAKMAKLLAVDFSAEAYIEEKSDMPEIVKDTKIICKMLGDSPKNVFGIDEYSDVPGAEKIYEKLVDEYYDIIDDNGFSGDFEIAINKKLNVIRSVDMTDQFTIYWFTAKSNF